MTARNEGTLTRAIETRTARIPSGAFLALAGGSVAASLIALLLGKRQIATFIGEWAPTVLLLGMYNKFVKQAT